MVSKEDFEKIVRRFGQTTVDEALTFRKRLLSKTENFSRSEALSKGCQTVYRLLFEADLDPGNLWERYREVSEPATVPHQSPRARDTSRTGVNGS